jgi:hypothetical protein
MSEAYRPNQVLSVSERDALLEVRRHANRSSRVLHQIWPLVVVLTVLVIQICNDSGSALLLAPVGVVVVYAWNSYRQSLDNVAVAIDGLYKIAEESERRRNSPL